jgi:hypothetical protein
MQGHPMRDGQPNRRWSRPRTLLIAILTLAIVAVIGIGSVLAAHDRHHQASQNAPTRASVEPTLPTVIPAPVANNDFCSRYPALPGAKPVASNTGVPSSVHLTVHGDMTVTKPGVAVTGLWIKGILTIAANNVTVEDNKVESPASDYFGIVINDGVVGTRILDNELWGDDGGYIGISARKTGSAAKYTFVCGNYLHNWENDLTVGPNMMVQANFIDAMQNHQNDTDADGIENYYGGNTRFWGNNILGFGPNGSSTAAINSALNITATGININDVQINGNWLGGGGGTVDLDQQQGAKTTNVSLTNNIWYTSPPAAYGPLNLHGTNIISAWHNNKLSTGATLDLPAD